jgi:hypothetical protein
METFICRRTFAKWSYHGGGLFRYLAWDLNESVFSFCCWRCGRGNNRLVDKELASVIVTAVWRRTSLIGGALRAVASSSTRACRANGR